ncbi:MAG: hypothetical protein Q4E45_10525 [Eubacteriales bacterium]|nr:hypothetical protein [Eubacteriales bacterium]
MSSQSIDKKIPIVVGVTGHRAIRQADRAALLGSVEAELSRLLARCPASPVVLLTSLAEGGDQLCAEAATALGIPLIVALPMEADEFEKDFTPEALTKFRTYCAQAGQVFAVPYTEAVPDGGITRDYLYRQAGIYISAHSHLLLALWDGGPGTEAACGTAEAVDFSLCGSYAPVTGAPHRSGSNTAVIHVYTPRKDRCAEPAGTVHMLGDMDALNETLARTEEYNRLAEGTGPCRNARLQSAEGDRILAHNERVSMASGMLSERYARIYRRILALLAAASTVLTLAFLLYDEAEAVWMILVCGAMLLAALLLQRMAVHSDCNRRYIEFRSLAECLRVETFLRYAGSGVLVSELLPWTEQAETAWILNALCALETGPRPETAHEIRECWIENQRDYHLRSCKKTTQKLHFSGRIVRTALLLSVSLYLAALLFELLCGGLIFRPRFPVADVEQYRTALKILLGVISAATLFIGNYYGRLSLDRKKADHEKMARFYQRMSEQLQRRGQVEPLLELIAREELIENGNWCSYQRDNGPDFSI